MNAATVAHRWANKDFGRQGTLTASNSCHSRGRNYFSYSTVFGQWLDLEKNVVAVFDGSTSSTSSKYKLYKNEFPKDVHVFPLDFGSNSYYGWRNCNLVSEYNFKDEDFKEYHRMQMLYHYCERLYDQFARIKNERSKGLENISFEAWDYFTELCSLYDDCSVKKFLAYLKQHGCKDNSRDEKAMKKMVSLIAKGERDVETITDAMFGEGTYKQYYEYCRRYRKAEYRKYKMLNLCSRLGIANPYERWCGDKVLHHEMSADEIRKLSAKERNEIHFRALAYKERKDNENERRQRYEKNRLNAYKWIVGCEPTYNTTWSGNKHYDDKVVTCRNMFTGEVYDISGDHVYGFYWCKTSMSFDYDKFRKSEDKEAWIRNFYAKCKEAQDNRKAIKLLKVYGITKEKKNSYDDDIYIGVTHRLAEFATEEDKRVVNEFIARQDKHYADEEARRRAAEIERQRIAEEKRREEEYQKQVKQEQITACLVRGGEGCRDLWRLHLEDLYDAHNEFDKTELTGCPEKYKDFFFGGNVLLRFNLDKTYVESSKGVRVPVAVAKLWFRMVKQWHEDEKSFKPMEWNTKGNGTYTVSEYKNDILTAGCHDIAYAEMERMYNQICAETA